MGINKAFLNKHADKISKIFIGLVIVTFVFNIYDAYAKPETAFVFATETKWEQQIKDLNYFDNEKITVKDAPIEGFDLEGAQSKNKIYLNKNINDETKFKYIYTHEYFHYLQKEFKIKAPDLSSFKSSQKVEYKEYSNVQNEVLTDLVAFQKLSKVESFEPTYLTVSEAISLMKNKEIKEYINYYVELSSFNLKQNMKSNDFNHKKFEDEIDKLNYFQASNLKIEYTEISTKSGVLLDNIIYVNSNIRDIENFKYIYTHNYFHYLQKNNERLQPKISNVKDKQNVEILTDLMTYSLTKTEKLGYVSVPNAKNLLKNDDVKKYVDFYVELSQFNSKYNEKMLNNNK